ncbi:uncharacterized protein DEA37_0013233 [Paragonimus westermani]|uniref:Tubulin/FtsZ GTPase domain-containing protein n=1 Tax=Paragonimus westermani TaxID=34504 RepID=A0A5J4NK34_9TREM|nr:uncharacterized protein DEA37_0013233 [Paragonimus westermani]
MVMTDWRETTKVQGQIIQCFLGHCGLQVGNAVWELACVENGLDPNGVKLSPDTADVDSGIDTAFTQTRSGRYVPLPM